MRIAYLDCFSGISGDMFLGALVDAGVPSAFFEETIAALNIGARLEISRVTRSGISATKADVYSNGEKDLPREEYWKRTRETQSHKHSHAHKAHAQRPVELLEHNFGSEPSRPASHTHEHEHGKGLQEIKKIISAASISSTAKSTAIAIFEALGAAEAKIHSTDIEKVHFHEVGAIDAMVDITCAAVGAEALNVEAIVCSPLNVGGGTVKCAHGTLPVPAPATVELLKGVPLYSNEVQAELVTPTGAAIVKTLATKFCSFPAMKVQATGYGAGSRDFERHANVLRLLIGEAHEQSAAASDYETISVLEANIDDLNPQVFGYVMDRLLDLGALDVFGVPVQMKKNRPGMLLTVLCRPENAHDLESLIFRETTTLGVRQRQEQRQALARVWQTVATRWGNVRLKVARMNGTITNYAPEYEDCRQIAMQNGVPLKSVMQEAIQLYRESLPK